MQENKPEENKLARLSNSSLQSTNSGEFITVTPIDMDITEIKQSAIEKLFPSQQMTFVSMIEWIDNLGFEWKGKEYWTLHSQLPDGKFSKVCPMEIKEEREPVPIQDGNYLNYYLLKGYAGVGKTFLISKLVDFLYRIYPNLKIAIACPTHRAADVVRSNFVGRGVKIPYIATIQSILQLAKTDPDEDGVENFIYKPRHNAIYYNDFDVVFVDEWSMIGKRLANYIVNYYHPLTFFVGDPCQLPPVKEDISPINNLPVTECNYAEMVHVVRNAGGILEYATTVRNCIVNNSTGTPLIQTNDNLIVLPKDEWINQMVESFKTNGMKATRALAWTNKRVFGINYFLRKAITGYDRNTPYLENETLISKKTVTVRNERNYPVVFLNSSDECIVKSISEDLQYDSIQGYLNVINGRYKHQVFDVFEIVDTFPKEFSAFGKELLESIEEFRKDTNSNNLSSPFGVYNLFVDRYDEYTYLKTPLYADMPRICKYLKLWRSCNAFLGKLSRNKKINESQKEAFIEVARTQWKAFNEFMDDFNIIYVNTDGNEGFNYRLNAAYATTIHQSQGGTFPYVFIDYGNIVKCRQPLLRNKLIYTGITRGAEYVYACKFLA